MLGGLADHIQRANIGGLNYGHQAEDQRAAETDGDTSGDRPGIEQEEHVDAQILHQQAHDVTHARGSRRANHAAHQTQQARLQAKEHIEIQAAIARGLEHGNLRSAA